VIFVGFGSLGGEGDQFGTQGGFEFFGKGDKVVGVSGTGATIVVDHSEEGTQDFYWVFTCRGIRNKDIPNQYQYHLDCIDSK